MKRPLICALVILAMTSTMAATRRHKYPNSRARDAEAIMQGIGGFINGVSEAAARQQQQQQKAYERQLRQQQQQQAAYERQRQLEYQRQQEQLRQRQVEAERLQRQRDIQEQQRQYEIEKQRLALDRQRWREEADKQGIEICGYMVPSWLWQSMVASAAFGLICLLLKCMFGRRS